jgi:hypothetical protein
VSGTGDPFGIETETDRVATTGSAGVTIATAVVNPDTYTVSNADPTLTGEVPTPPPERTKVTAPVGMSGNTTSPDASVTTGDSLCNSPSVVRHDTDTPTRGLPTGVINDPATFTFVVRISVLTRISGDEDHGLGATEAAVFARTRNIQNPSVGTLNDDDTTTATETAAAQERPASLLCST